MPKIDVKELARRKLLFLRIKAIVEQVVRSNENTEKVMRELFRDEYEKSRKERKERDKNRKLEDDVF